MGRATSGVGGIRLREGDQLLSMQVVESGQYVVTITDGGFGKRTPIEEWSRKNRNIQGVRAMRLVSERGGLIGALVCDEGDEVLAIADNGTVIRTPVEQIRATSRDTMGVSVMGLAEGRSVVAIARAAERDDDPTLDDEDSDPNESGAGESSESSDGPGRLKEPVETDSTVNGGETIANSHAEEEEGN